MNLLDKEIAMDIRGAKIKLHDELWNRNINYGCYFSAQHPDIEVSVRSEADKQRVQTEILDAEGNYLGYPIRVVVRGNLT